MSDGDNLTGSVWADTAYRSQANLRLLDRRGLVPELQRRKLRRGEQGESGTSIWMRKHRRIGDGKRT